MRSGKVFPVYEGFRTDRVRIKESGACRHKYHYRSGNGPEFS